MKSKMKPILITFKKSKENHSYAIKNKKGELELIKSPKVGDNVEIQPYCLFTGKVILDNNVRIGLTLKFIMSKNSKELKISYNILY